MEKAHTQALWMFGIVVALAVREALQGTMTHLFPQNSLATSASHSMVLALFEVARVVVFVTTIVRFYFGAVVYFNKQYGENAKPGYRNFGVDFASGLVHFFVFFGWAYSITSHAEVWQGTSAFLLLTWAVLLYDWAWLLASLRYVTVRYIAVWAFLNLFAILFSIALWFVMTIWVGSDRRLAETISLIPVMLAAFIDFADMTSGKHLFGNWLRSFLDPRDPSVSA